MRKPGGQFHKHRTYVYELIKSYESYAPGKKADYYHAMLCKDPYLSDESSDKDPMSRPTVYRILDEVNNDIKKGEAVENLNLAFLKPSAKETMEWMRREYSFPIGSWPLMSDLWYLTQNVVIGSENDRLPHELKDQGPEPYGLRPVRPLMLRPQTPPSGYLPLNISNRHALWVWWIHSATQGLTMLDKLMFAVEFCRREGIEEQPNCQGDDLFKHDDLLGYVAYHPWSSKKAASRYWHSIWQEAVPPLNLNIFPGSLPSVTATNDEESNPGPRRPIIWEDYLRALWLRFEYTNGECASLDVYPDLLPSQSLRWSLDCDKPGEDISTGNSDIYKNLYEAEQDYLNELASPVPADSGFKI